MPQGTELRYSAKTEHVSDKWHHDDDILAILVGVSDNSRTLADLGRVPYTHSVLHYFTYNQAMLSASFFSGQARTV